MRVDIIVPTFDNLSDEVTLSLWYKKVGDKISKNEIIADAETPFVACGITSSYDCVLAKILVKEGGVISQGTKIAVIETDLNANVSDITKSIGKEEAKTLSGEVAFSISDSEESVLSPIRVNDTGYCLSVPLEEKGGNEEEIVEEFSEQTEEKCKNILNNAKSQAIEEALKLKEQILSEARKMAIIQAEELKTKILKEYEEKATQDAGEMHKRVVHGSLLEAENMRTKLIEEARGKAMIEAQKLEEKIIEDAKKKANLDAETTIREAVDHAKEEAKFKAESLSREIIEEAIAESKSETRAIKKDIIHSAQKHAAKESAEIIKNAKITSNFQAKELIKSAIHSVSSEADSLKNEIICKTNEEIQAVMNSILHSTVEEIHKEIGRYVYDVMKGLKIQITDSFKKNVEDIRKEITKEMEYGELIPEKIVPQVFVKKNKDDLHQKIMVEKDSQMKKQSEIVKKLLRTERENSPSELYADNWNKPKFFESPGDYNEPIDLLKRRISEKIKNTYDASVISTVSNEIDMSAVLVLEKTFGSAFTKKHNVRLGFTPFFISASIAALKQYHIFNAHIHNDEIIYKSNFDISIITCGNDGIAAPVIRHADTLTIAELEKVMIALSRRAMEGTLSIEEVSGGTFTLINAGIYGSLIGTDLLTPPQVATLSVHKMHNRPIATDGNMEIRPMLYISLSYDHRISDTRKASEFLANIKNYLENPGWQILGL
ncbi:MAG: 2-oxo acid dehydrogenase subunit E2 [Holosporaceae bacterium]|jgi:2-oxoglutarate dehydrogenase E2 component (dihydrolipoamide succinyltransferase)|nr:2-oxo acid dehydrogenase subunit E2 [Holosporaceae bacterium]